MTVLRAISGWALALLLSACGGSPEVEVRPAALPAAPIAIPAERVDIDVKSSRYAAGAPKESEFLVTPEQVARNWAKRRLNMAGGGNTARYIIDDAYVQSNPTPTGEEVAVGLDVRLVLAATSGARSNTARASVEARTLFNRGASAIERWQRLQLLSEDLSRKLDRAMSGAVERDLAAVLNAADEPPPARFAAPAQAAPQLVEPAPEAARENSPSPAWETETVLAPPAEVVDMTPDAEAERQAALPPPHNLAASPPMETVAVPAAPAPTLSISQPVTMAPVVSEGDRQAPPVRAPDPKPAAAPRPADAVSAEPEAGALDLSKGAFLPGTSSFPALPK